MERFFHSIFSSGLNKLKEVFLPLLQISARQHPAAKFLKRAISNALHPNFFRNIHQNGILKKGSDPCSQIPCYTGKNKIFMERDLIEKALFRLLAGSRKSVAGKRVCRRKIQGFAVNKIKIQFFCLVFSQRTLASAI